MDSGLPRDNRIRIEPQTTARGYEKRAQNAAPPHIRRGNSWNVSSDSERELASTRALPAMLSEVNTVLQSNGERPYKLTRNRDQIRDLKLQLERAKQNVTEIEMEKRKLERQYKSLYGDFCDLELDLKQKHRQAMDQAKRGWIRECNGLEETIEDLQQQLEHEKQHVALVKQLADQIHMEKDTSMVVFAPQMMDSNVCEDFSSLLDDIRTWSTKFSCDTGRTPEFRSESIFRYQQVVPLCTSLADIMSFMNQYQEDKRLDEKSWKQFDKMRKRHFIRGWASFVMIERCFCSPDSWLRTTDSEAVHQIERVLSETGSEYRKDIPDRAVHDWRALTAYLLSKATPQDTQDKLMGKVASKAASDVMGLLHPWAKSVRSEELERGLADIYHAAIQLSCLLRKQRAYWELYFPTKDASADSLPYDSFSMEEINNKSSSAAPPEKRVAMVIEPALSKRGKIDGTMFEAGAHVMMKAKVCLAV